MTPSLATFYAPARQGRAFGVWASDYTIALAPNDGGYHIGQDYTTGRQPLEVPAILAGTVVRVRLAEGVLGSVVVVRSTWAGRTVYVQYSHLSKERLPSVGDWIDQGGRVGRLAAGPNARTATRNNPAVSISNIEWPGTGWDGIHLHLVISLHPDAGYSKVAGYRTLAAFFDPRPIIAAILASAASGGSRPFDPEEDDDMYENDKPLRDRLDQVVDYIKSLNEGLTGKVAGEATDTRRMVAANFEGLTGVVRGEADQTRQHVNRRINDLAGWTRDDANALRAAIGASAGTDPAKIAEALAPLIPTGASAKAVADELAKRLSS